MTNQTNGAIQRYETPEDHDITSLREELEATRETNRKLQDQLKKAVKAASNAERASAEAMRAHTMMVETLTETMRENTALAIERDMWQSRARRAMALLDTPTFDVHGSLGVTHITEDEAKAIRKAIARLHHPDSGGDAERMKMWNASLDQIEHHS